MALRTLSDPSELLVYRLETWLAEEQSIGGGPMRDRPDRQQRDDQRREVIASWSLGDGQWRTVDGGGLMGEGYWTVSRGTVIGGAVNGGG